MFNYLILTARSNAVVTIFDDEITDGAALRFDGVDDYVNVPDSASLRITNTITVEAWIKRATIGVQHSIVEKYGCSGQGGYLLRVRTDDRLDVRHARRLQHWRLGGGQHAAPCQPLVSRRRHVGRRSAPALRQRRAGRVPREAGAIPSPAPRRCASALAATTCARLRRRDRRGARVECRADGGRNSREREPVPGRRRTGSGRLLAL